MSRNNDIDFIGKILEMQKKISLQEVFKKNFITSLKISNKPQLQRHRNTYLSVLLYFPHFELIHQSCDINIICIKFKMGPRNSKQTKNNFMSDYDIIQKNQAENLTYLQHKSTEHEFLLREFNFNDKKQCDKTLDKIVQLKNKLAGNKHVAPLKDYLTSSEDQYCSTFYKIYALFEYPQRTLDDEINERNLQKRRFSETQLWSILASCILGMSHLQKNGIKHSALKSSNILLSQEGIIKIADPFATGTQPNYDICLNKRNTPHLYLSPEQTSALQQQLLTPNLNPYKSDIWTMGMILLEAALLQYQDECYRDQLSRIHWETLQYSINRLGEAYSEEIKNMIEFMLSRDERVRPDWLDLEEHVMKTDEGKRSFIQDEAMQIDRSSIMNIDRATVDNRHLGQSNQPPQQQMHDQQRISMGLPLSNMNFPQDKYRSSTFSPRNPSIANNIPPQQRVSQLPINYQPQPQYMYQNNRVSNGYRSPSIGQPFGQTGDQNTLLPVKISIIDQSRPLRNIFPVDTYQVKTKIDENLILVEEQDDNESRGFASNQNYENYARPFNMIHRQSEQDNYTQNRTTETYNRAPSQSSPNNQYRLSSQENRSIKNQNQTGDDNFVVENFKKGSRYQGYKKDGMRHGHGKFFYQDGGMYDGEWFQNKMNGYGKLYYQSGKLAYDGYWKADQFTGSGVLYNQIPQVLEGNFDYRNMQDVEDYWVKYEGQFADDMKNGHGILYLSNNEKFQGNFISDSIQGRGIFYRKNGQQITGKWQNNIKVQ